MAEGDADTQILCIEGHGDGLISTCIRFSVYSYFAQPYSAVSAVLVCRSGAVVDCHESGRTCEVNSVAGTYYAVGKFIGGRAAIFSDQFEDVVFVFE